MKKLSIIIPAYNEEKAISDIIDRCVAAKEYIYENTSLSDVEIIVVNDGSTDNTYKIAKSAKEAGKILLVSYKQNRNYGAAIKRGFRRASGDYVAFLDANGTCDPRCFVDLFNNLEKNDADISIGSRMGPKSQMPNIRRLGNLIYAFLINLIGNAKITDSASGMRIIKKSALNELYPLPDGMHFTPAMSAKAVFNDRLKIVEVSMPYKERVGESKLDVMKDGFRFLNAIFEMGLFYKPLKYFFLIAFVLLTLCLFYGVPLVFYYLEHRRILETDIYRIISIIVMGVLSVNLFLLGGTADQIISLFDKRPTLYQRIKNRCLKSFFFPFFSPRNMSTLGISLVLLGVLLNYKTVIEYLLYRKIDIHWVYVVTGAFFILLGAEIISYTLLQKLLLMYKNIIQFRSSTHRISTTCKI